MKHYSQLPRPLNVFRYNQLSSAAKAVARAEVLKLEELYLRKYIATARKDFTALGINRVINRPYHISNLAHKLKMIRRYKENQKLLEETIKENLCDFLESGEYVSYSNKEN